MIYNLLLGVPLATVFGERLGGGRICFGSARTRELLLAAEERTEEKAKENRKRELILISTLHDC